MLTLVDVTLHDVFRPGVGLAVKSRTLYAKEVVPNRRLGKPLDFSHKPQPQLLDILPFLPLQSLRLIPVMIHTIPHAIHHTSVIVRVLVLSLPRLPPQILI